MATTCLPPRVTRVRQPITRTFVTTWMSAAGSTGMMCRQHRDKPERHFQRLHKIYSNESKRPAEGQAVKRCPLRIPALPESVAYRPFLRQRCLPVPGKTLTVLPLALICFGIGGVLILAGL